MMQVYLDYNASTPIDPAATAVMRPPLAKDYGNSGGLGAIRGSLGLSTAKEKIEEIASGSRGRT